MLGPEHLGAKLNRNDQSRCEKIQRIQDILLSYFLLNDPFDLCFLQDNIVCLPPKLAQILGNISPICICSHVTQTVHLIDPNTLQGQLFIACYNDSSTSNCPPVFVKLVDQIVIYTVS